MPYGGTNKKEDAKIERCVISVMKTGKSKESAIKICKATIMSEKKFDFETDDKEDFANTLKGVEIFREGIYRGKKFTKKMLKEMVDNFKKLKKNADFEPPVRIGHRVDGRSDVNANNLIGYVTDLKIEEDDKGISHIYADSEITDDEGFKKIKDTTLRKRSVELGNYEDNDGNKYKNVLWGYGWVDSPQVEKLKPVFSAEVSMFDKTFDVELYDIEMAIDKKDIKSINKAIDSVKKLLDLSANKEDYWRVQRLAETLTTLKSMLPMEVDMAKDEEKEKLEKEKLEKEKLEKEKLEKEKKEKKDKEELDKKKKDKDNDEEIILSKDEHKDLMEAKTKVEKLEKIEIEKEKKIRIEEIDKFNKEGKIIADNLDKEKEFVAGLSTEQFETYKDIKNSQPEFIKLDADKGTQKSNEKKEDEENDPVKIANETVTASLKEKGWTDEDIKTHLDTFN